MIDDRSSHSENFLIFNNAEKRGERKENEFE